MRFCERTELGVVTLAAEVGPAEHVRTSPCIENE
jgi:hypothetical protein